jgi:Copper binding proteins, plastocyanin/azurin family
MIEDQAPLSQVLRIAVLIGLALAVSGATHATAGPAANPVLIATVGTNDGTDIDLADVNAVHVSRLTAGTYDIVVRDRSRLHNFHLASNSDPTVDFRTELDFVGEMTFTVTFRDETRYAYACEPHWQTMNGEFFVSSRPAPPPPAKPPPPPPVLRAGVTRRGKPFVTKRRVDAGSYRLVVQDNSRRANFHIRGNGVNRRTARRFTGTKRWTVKLASGNYRFGSDPRLTGTLTVR